MKKFIQLAVVAGTISLLTACGGGGTSHNHFDDIMNPKDGLVRGSSMGDTEADVNGRESGGDGEVEEGEGYVYVDVIWNEFEDYSVSYYFDDDGLYEVDIDVILESDTDAEALTDAFTKRFNDKFGSAEDEDGDWVWYGESSRGSDIEVSLSLDTDEFSSYVYVNFYELADGE